MNRFSLIGRLGADDRTLVKVLQKDSKRVEINFINSDRRFDFGIGQALEQLRSIGLRPSERALDLVVIAALVNAADTRVSRSLNAQDGWTRELDIYAPVSDPVLWGGQSAAITLLLRFLTGDRWRIFFRGRPARQKTVIVAPDKMHLDGLDCVCLFSGGLDSLIGATDLFAAKRKPLLVSHYWDGETAKAQSYLLDRVRRRFPTPEIRSMRVRLGFDKHDIQTGQSENSQRGRSFLFFSLAALAADSLQRQTTIAVPENGLIALNVPLDPLRLGALSTRTAHPYSIARMNDLIGSIGIKATLENPYRHQTKGEMLARCADKSFIAKEVRNSMSCSSPGKVRYKGVSPRHCGYCVPCLIRRASIVAAKIPDQTLYGIPDLSAQVLHSNRAEGEHARSFLLMAGRLNRRSDLSKYLVHKPGPLFDAPNEIPAYADVFRRGILEVESLLQGARVQPKR